MAFYKLQYIEFILNFARLKNICKILTTYQGFCTLFSTAQNSAVPAVKPGEMGVNWTRSRKFVDRQCGVSIWQFLHCAPYFFWQTGVPPSTTHL
jgi:hypothetical protein